jgi:hypothetical protein
MDDLLATAACLLAPRRKGPVLLVAQEPGGGGGWAAAAERSGWLLADLTSEMQAAVADEGREGMSLRAFSPT